MAATPHWIFLLLSFFLLRQFGQALMGPRRQRQHGPVLRAVQRARDGADGGRLFSRRAGAASVLHRTADRPTGLAARAGDVRDRYRLARGHCLVMSGLNRAERVSQCCPLLLRDMPARNGALEARARRKTRGCWLHAAGVTQTASVDARRSTARPAVLAAGTDDAGTVGNLHRPVLSHCFSVGGKRLEPRALALLLELLPHCCLCLESGGGLVGRQVHRDPSVPIFPPTLWAGPAAAGRAYAVCGDDAVLVVACHRRGVLRHHVQHALARAVRRAASWESADTQHHMAVVFVSASGPLVMGGLKDLGVIAYSARSASIAGCVRFCLACGDGMGRPASDTDSRPLWPKQASKVSRPHAKGAKAAAWSLISKQFLSRASMCKPSMCRCS